MPARSPTLRRSAPWLATTLAVALVVTPTYGLGLMVAPLTLMWSWIALRRDDSRSLALRAGAAANVGFLVLALAVLTAAWGWTWPVRNTWAVLVVVLSGILLMTRLRRPGSHREMSGGTPL
jgi:hypothetical protein